MIDPVDLRSVAGDRYRMTADPSATLDTSREGRPWYDRIPCRRGGFISVYGRAELAAYARGRIATRLVQLPGVRLLQRGDSEARVAFNPAMLDVVADLLGAYRRPVLTDEERGRRAERAKSMRKTPVITVP